GPHEQQAPVRDVRLARPDLLPAHPPLLAVPLRPAAERRKVRARSRLGEAETPHLLRRQDGWEEPFALRRAAIVDEQRADDVHGDRVEDRRRPHARQLLGVDDLLLQSGAAAAVLPRPVDADPAAGRERALPRAQEPMALLLRGRHRLRRQMRAEPRAQLAPERLLLAAVGEREHGHARLTPNPGGAANRWQRLHAACYDATAGHGLRFHRRRARLRRRGPRLARRAPPTRVATPSLLDAGRRPR